MKKNFYKKLKFGYNIKENLKWSLFVLIFIIVIVLLTTPPYIWLDLDWVLYLPPLLVLWSFIIPILASIFAGTMLRFIYVLYKRG